jgi:hypothetical protein
MNTTILILPIQPSTQLVKLILLVVFTQQNANNKNSACQSGKKHEQILQYKPQITEL